MEEILLEDETEVQESETIISFSGGEPETVVASDEGLGVVDDDTGISALSAYDGNISTTYIEYFRGLVSKLPPFCHYLFYRDSQYSYVLYYSDSLEVSGAMVRGSAVDYYRLNTYNGYVLSSGASNVNENITTGMYYSDLPGCPDLRGGDYYVQVSAVFVLCLIFVFMLLNLMYRLARCFRRV